MLNQEHIDLIDGHLNGGLNKSEQQAFDQLLTQDPAFAKALDETKLAHQAIHRLGLLETVSKLDQIHVESQRKNNRNKWILGMSLLLVVTLGGFFYFSKEEVRSEPTIPMELGVVETEEDLTRDNNRIASPTSELIPENTQTPPKESMPEFTVAIRTEEDVEIQETPIGETITYNSKEEVVDEGKVREEPTLITESRVEAPDCSLLKIGHVKVIPTCLGEQNGSVVLDMEAIHGGLPPYKTTLYSKDEEEAFYLAEGIGEGVYKLVIQDANACSTSTTITVSTKRCIKRIDATFSPNYGETWTYPTITEVTAYTVTLKDVANRTVLDKEVLLHEESDWNGRLDNGSIIGKGVYLVEIKDGKETYAVGSITVVE